MYPPNPLDNFQSHSYHHILIGCNNTEAVRLLAGGASQTFLSSVSNVMLGNEIQSDGKPTGCYLIIDSRRTSEFAIEALNFDSYIVSGPTPLSSTTVPVAMTMRVIDPSGVGFFNYFKFLMDQKFQCDVTGITFLLHTFFVGHTDDGKTETVYSNFMPMIMGATFNLTDFGTKGGMYDLTFLPMDLGGISNCDSYNQLYKDHTFSSRAGLLGNAIQAFEDSLNLNSKKWYLTINPSMEMTPDGKVKNPSDKEALNRRGRMVQYMITIPPEWFYYEVNTSSDNAIEKNWVKYYEAAETIATEEQKKEAADLEKQREANRKQGLPEPEGNFNTKHATSINMTIEDGISSIFDSSPQVKALAAKDAKNAGDVVIYKTLTSISSDEETILVHYDIVTYTIPNTEGQKKIIESTNKHGDNHPSTHPNGDNNGEGKDKGINDNNKMIFDYIFSGMNNDVLDLKIQANNLFLGLMTKSNTGQIAKEIRIRDNQIKNEDTGRDLDKDSYGTVTRFQPLIPPARTADQYVGFAKASNELKPNATQRMADAQEFHKTLADLNSPAGTVEMKIRGNPEVIKRYTVSKIVPHVKLSGSLKQFLTDASTDENYSKSSAWEYSGLSAPKAGSENTVSGSHVLHRKFVDEICKPVQEGIDKLKKDSKDNNDDFAATSFLGGATWALVNIYGPSDYSFAHETDASVKVADDKGNNYRTKLFYDSWYLVSKVSHSFEHGSFTQMLTLHMLDLYNSPGMNENTDKVNEDKKVNTGQVVDSTPPKPSVPVPPPVPPVIPTVKPVVNFNDPSHPGVGEGVKQSNPKNAVTMVKDWWNGTGGGGASGSW